MPIEDKVATLTSTTKVEVKMENDNIDSIVE